MIYNVTKRRIISERELKCNTLWSCMIGLMFHRKANLIMFFPNERRISLHNWFVFYPIDVLVLNEDSRIVEIKNKFYPFTFWNAKCKGKYLIELAFPRQYKVGDKVKIS